MDKYSIITRTKKLWESLLRNTKALAATSFSKLSLKSYSLIGPFSLLKVRYDLSYETFCLLTFLISKITHHIKGLSIIKLIL